MASSRDIQVAVDNLANHFKTSVLIEDAKQFPIWWSTNGEVDPIRSATVLYRNVEPEVANVVDRFGLRQARNPIRTPEISELGMWSRVAMPIRDTDQVVGFLWVLDPKNQIPDSELNLISELAHLAGPLLANTSSKDSEHLKTRSVLLDQLLHFQDENAAAQLAQLEQIPVDSKIQVDAFGKIGGWHLSNGFTVHVVDKEDSSATSGASVPLVQLAIAFNRAKLTQCAIKAGAKLTTNTWDQLGPWRLIVDAPESLSPTDLCPQIEILLEQENVELLETARALLDAGGDISSVAKSLFIHRTTLYYRVDRILDLTGIDLKSGSDRTQLQLALWLDAFRKAT